MAQAGLDIFSWFSTTALIIVGIVLNATTARVRTREASQVPPRPQSPTPPHTNQGEHRRPADPHYPGSPYGPPPAGNPGYPAPLPQEQPQHTKSSTAWMPNILLGVACLFLIAAAITFASVTGSPLVRALAIGVVAALSYVAGLVIYALSARLKPVGFALVALGMALLPIAAGLLGAADSISASVAWLLTSIVGVIAYVLAAILLKSETILWFGLLFIGSLVLSIINFVPVPPVAFFYGLMVTAIVFSLVGALGRKRLPARIVRPHVLLGEILAPASAFACLFVSPFPSTYQWAILFALLTAFYVISASLNGWGWQVIVARVTAAITIALAANAITKLFSDTGHANITATGLALLVVELWHVVEAIIRRANASFRMTVHIVTSVCFVLGAGLATFQIANIDGRLFIPIGLTFTALTVAHTIFAFMTDTPLQRALAYSSAIMSAVSLACVVAYFIGEDKSGVIISYIIAAGVFVIADAVLTGWLVRSRGRSRRRLRIASPLFTVVFPLCAFAPSFVALFFGIQVWQLVVLFVLVLACVGLAFVVRSGLFTLSTVPLLFTFSYGIDSFVAGSRDSWNWIISRPLLLVFYALLATCLMMASAHLYSRGRHWRARYSAIASLIVAGLGACNALLPTFAPNFPYSILFITANVIDLAAFVAGLEVSRRLTRHEHERRTAIARAQHAELAKQARVVPFKSSPVPVFVMLFAIAVCAHAVGAAAPKFEEWYFFAIAGVVATATILYLSHVLRIQWFTLATVVTVPTFTFAVTSQVLEGNNRNVLALIFAWAIMYAVHWAQALVKRKPLASLIVATFMLVAALGPALVIDNSAVPIPSFARVIVGLIFLATAATVMTAVRSTSHRAVFLEIGSYLGALGVAISFSGLVRWNFYVPLHIVALTVLFWAWWYGGRGGFPWLGSRSVGTQTRLYITFGVMTFIGLIVSLVKGDFYTAVFLTWLVLFLITGALTNRPVLVWCSVGTLAFSAIWLLRHVVWLVLVVLALVIIGVVVWMLLRGNQKHENTPRPEPRQPMQAPPVGQAPPQAPSIPQPPKPMPYPPQRSAQPAPGRDVPPPQAQWQPPAGPPPRDRQEPPFDERRDPTDRFRPPNA